MIDVEMLQTILVTEKIRIDKLLRRLEYVDNEDIEELEEILSDIIRTNTRRIVVHSENNIFCPLHRVKNDENFLELLIAPGERRKGLKEIRDFIKGAKKITIVDPYLFQTPTDKNDDEYFQELRDMFIKSKNIKAIEVFTLPSPKKSTLNKFKKNCSTIGIKFKLYLNNLIHDRVLIIDEADALILGTSFGGFGNKYAFIVKMPDEDAKKFKKALGNWKIIIYPL